MLGNLKGDDLLQGTNTIDFDKPRFDKPVIDLRFRDGKNITDEPVVYDTDISDLVADSSKTNRELLDKILNPDLKVDEFMDKKEQREKIYQQFLKDNVV